MKNRAGRTRAARSKEAYSLQKDRRTGQSIRPAQPSGTMTAPTTFNFVQETQAITARIRECHHYLSDMVQTLRYLPEKAFSAALVGLINNGNLQYLSLSEIIQCLDDCFNRDNKRILAFLHAIGKASCRSTITCSVCWSSITSPPSGTWIAFNPLPCHRKQRNGSYHCWPTCS